MNECKPLALGCLGDADGDWHHVRTSTVRHHGRRGRAVQVDPIKPTLKAPGTKRLKLKYDKLLQMLLKFCFRFQLASLQRGGGDGARRVGVAGGGSGAPLHAQRRRVGPAGCTACDVINTHLEYSFLKLSVGVTRQPEILEVEGQFTQGLSSCRTVGESVGGIFGMHSSDWSNEIRYHAFGTRPDTEFKFNGIL